MSNIVTNKKVRNAAKTVRQVISAMPSGHIFFGWELKNRCVEINPAIENMYVDTLLREMRKSCKDQYQLIDRAKSQYQKIGDAVILEETSQKIKRPELQKYANMTQQELAF